MSEAKTDMMLNGICMVCENKDTLCTHIGQVKEDCPFIQKAMSTKITNADKIRSMTDEELEEFIDKVSGTCIVDALGGKSECNTECRMCKIKFGSILDWLQSEAE